MGEFGGTRGFLAKLSASLLLVFAVFSVPLRAETVYEPKKISSPKKLKLGDGAVRLSVRTQGQYTDTFYLYFVQVSESGSDTDKYIRFERGAGLPLAGSNMIDSKAAIYQIPLGRYRLVAYTMRCQSVPRPGTQCFSSLSGALPTGHYAGPSPTFEVKSGAYTDAGDYIYEYQGPLPKNEVDELKEIYNGNSDMRWRPLIGATPQNFAALPVTAAPNVPDRFRSQITCEIRPKGVSLFIPFSC
jgi:hypothetical protein